MAKAFCNTVVETKTIKTITLVLTEVEASALRALTGKVSGSAAHSIRGYTDQVFYALGSAGIATDNVYSKSLNENVTIRAASIDGLSIDQGSQ